MNERPETLAREVRERFGRLALAPYEEAIFVIGPESAKRLGYDAAEIDALPVSATESFAGVGQMLTDAGFADAKFHGWTGYRTSPSTEGGLVSARKPIR